MLARGLFHQTVRAPAPMATAAPVALLLTKEHWSTFREKVVVALSVDVSVLPIATGLTYSRVVLSLETELSTKSQFCSTMEQSVLPSTRTSSAPKELPDISKLYKAKSGTPFDEAFNVTNTAGRPARLDEHSKRTRDSATRVSE